MSVTAWLIVNDEMMVDDEILQQHVRLVQWDAIILGKNGQVNVAMCQTAWCAQMLLCDKSSSILCAGVDMVVCEAACLTAAVRVCSRKLCPVRNILKC
jgi:hypothetical protein